MSVPGGVDGGTIRMGVVADATGLERDLQAKVSAAAARVKAKIQVEADTARAQAQIEALRQSAARQIKIQADVDTARAEAALAALGRSGAGIKIGVDADLTAAKAKIDAFRAEQQANKITIKVDADTSAATKAATGLRTTLAGLGGKSTTVRVAASGFDAVAKGIDTVASGLLSFGKAAGIVAIIPELIGAVTNLGGAFISLTSAVGPAVNVLGLIPAALTTVTQGALAVVAGFAGIPAALKAYQQANVQATATAASNAKAQEAAAQRVKSAVEAVAAAQRQAAQDAESSAQRVADAETRLVRAVTDGQDRIAAARAKVRAAGGTVVSSGPAGTSDLTNRAATPPREVTDAQTRLARVVEDNRDRITKAEQDVTRAQADAAESARQSAEQVAKAQRAVTDVSVRGARAVADANQALAKAVEDQATRAADAEQRIADAEQTVVDRQAAAVKAQDTLTQARKDAQRTLDELTLSLRGASLDEEDATLAVIRAKQQLDKVNRSQAAKPLDKQEADLAYREAQQRLDEVKQKNKELTADAAAAQQAGVEGAANVVAAKAAVTSTAQDVAKAGKDLQAAQEDAARSTVATAQAVAAAQQGIVDAQTKAVQDNTDAQTAYSDAVHAQSVQQVKSAQAVADAQRGMAVAARDNARNLTDAQEALSVARAQAAKDLAAAQKDLADAEKDYTRSVGDASKDLQRARDDSAQTAANDAIRVAQAEEALASARRNQADTMDKESTGAKALDAAYKNLSPTAQEFVRFLANEFLPAFRDIRKAAQDGLLPGVETALKTIMPYFPSIGAALQSTASIIGSLAAAGAKLLTSGPFRKDFGAVASSNDIVIRNLGQSFLDIIDVFRNVATVGGPFLVYLSAKLREFTGHLRALTQNKRDSGGLARLFGDAVTTAGRLWRIVRTLGDALFNMGHAARPSGDSLLQSLSDVIDRFDAWTKSPTGQQAMSEFFNQASEWVRTLGPPLSKLGQVISKTTEMQGFADGLNLIASGLLAISKVPGVAHIFDGLLYAAGAALAIGALLKVLSPLIKGVGLLSAGIGKLRRSSNTPTPAAAPATGSTSAGTAGKTYRVTWGPGALPVRIVGGVGGPGVADPFDPATGGGTGKAPHAPGTVGPDGRIWGPDPGTVGPMAATRRQRAAAALGRGATRVGASTGITRVVGRVGAAATSAQTRVAATRVGGAATRVAARAGGAVGGRVGRVGAAAARGTGRLAGTGALGFAGVIAGGLAANAIIGNSKRGSGRNILGSALGSGIQGAALGATVGSIIPGVGTAIGAAVGGAIGAIYGAIKAGLTLKKVEDMLASTGAGIKAAWDHTIGPVVSTVVGWFEDIVHAAQSLYDRLVGHSIIPDLVNGIRDLLGTLLAPITDLIRWFTHDIPDAAQKTLDWVTTNWGKITGLFTAPFDLIKTAVGLYFTGLRAAFTSLLSWVIAPASWNWGAVLGVVTKPITDAVTFLTGVAGFGAVRGAFTAVLSWVTAPASWNWGKVLGVVTKPITDAVAFLGGVTGFGAVRAAFTGVLTWVTSPGTWNWASDVVGVLKKPITSAINFLTGGATGFADIKTAFTSMLSWVTDGKNWDWAASVLDVFTKPITDVITFLVGKSPGKKLGGAFGDIAGFFGTLATAAGSKLDAIRGAVAEPIVFVIDTVINDGLIAGFNFLADKLPGLGSIKKIPIPGALRKKDKGNPGGYAEGGVLPGWTPGRDVHHFTSPTGGTLNLSGGEAVMRPEFTAAVGPATVHALNRLARTRGAEGVRAALSQSFVLGGVVGAVKKGAGAVTSGAITAGRAVINATESIGGAITGAAKAVADPVGFIQDKIHEVLDNVSKAVGTTALAQIAAAVPKAAGQAVLNRVTGFFTGGTGGGGGGPTAPPNPGLNGAVDWARTQVGKPYIWGGVGPAGYDCSGFQSALVNVIQGLSPYVRRFATGTLPAGLFAPGPGAYEIGWFTGDPGHTAGTINGVNVESRGGEGVVVGSRARGAHDPLFDHHGHLKGYAQGGVLPHTLGDGQRGDAAFDYFDPRGKHYARNPRDLVASGAAALYDQGGVLPTGTTLVHNGTGQAEAVLTGDQWRTLRNLVGKAPDVQDRPQMTAVDLAAALRAASPVTIDVHPAAGMDEAAVARRTAFELEWARR